MTPHQLLLEQACAFIANYYAPFQNAAVTYKPTPDQILSYLANANEPGFLTVYLRAELLFARTGAIPNQELCGVITARPLQVRQNGATAPFSTYYVDNLCVKPVYRKKGLTPQLIQTNYHHFREQNPRIQTALFKREGTLTTLVPFVTFQTRCFDVTQFLQEEPRNLHAAITCVPITAGAPLALFMALINTQCARFLWQVVPDLGNLSTLLKNGNIIIYGLQLSGALLAAYVFRKTALQYNNRAVIECIAAIATDTDARFATNAADTDARFAAGFQLALFRLQTPLLLLEDTADAHRLRSASFLKAAPLLFSSPTAFYFYNYICYSAKASEVLLLY